MKQPNLDEFKAWAKAHRMDAMTVCAAQAIANVERERVDAYIRPIFDRFTFLNKRTGEQITNPDDLYLAEDPRLDEGGEYWEACDAAHRDHGFTGKRYYCPALIADPDLIKSQNKFLRLGCDLFGLEDIPSMPDHRKKMLDLLLGACLIKERKAA